MAAQYEIVAVGRTPQQLTGPVLEELGPLRGGFTLTETLNDAGELSMSVNMGTLIAAIKTRLRNLRAQPMEIWVYRDSVRIFRGPVVGGDISGDSVNLTARGMLFYMHYMLVETDKSWTATDIYTIGAELVDDWQDQDYGNYGINTVGVGTAGVTRDHVIAGATETPRVFEALKNFAEGVFDFWVDPTDASLNFGTKGQDKSATVFLERGIQSPNSQFSVAPDFIASEVYATGTGPGVDPALTSVDTNTTVRTSWGRAGVGITHDPVSDQNHLDDLAAADLADRSDAYFKPGPGMIPLDNAQWDTFDNGDTVSYAHDDGLGQVSGTYRVVKRVLTVGTTGQEKISVEFE